MKKQKLGLEIVKYGILIIGLILILFPVYLTAITAMKTTEQTAKNFFSLPSSFYLENFKEVISKANFNVVLMNSIVIIGISLLFITILTPMVSYSIARNSKKGYYKFIFAYITVGIFIPFQVIMVPLTILMSKMNLMNQGGLIILYITFAMIQSVFLYVGFIKAIPNDMEEAAYIDGCSKSGTYVRIVFPLLRPITATVLIMNALWIWNDFLLPLLILNKSPNYWTIQLFQYNFRTRFSFDYRLASASFLMSTLPVVAIYLLMQKQIVSGLTNGAVKG